MTLVHSEYNGIRRPVSYQRANNSLSVFFYYPLRSCCIRFHHGSVIKSRRHLQISARSTHQLPDGKVIFDEKDLCRDVTVCCVPLPYADFASRRKTGDRRALLCQCRTEELWKSGAKVYRAR
ncbi:hypothetical protein GWI33_017594 [Rhynchophorus ferrugineus]|uniref:Uncharacterized protein n=1 Tax=Rhynchophorus ferrugineus TaxID=354439 RepID=A0A834HYC8_RHYFE|nr:hypothetical protein GWI33_017594 [Rhynchophorus ferrugineus]